MFQVHDSDGSNPPWDTKNNAVVAQLVERLLAMQEVFLRVRVSSTALEKILRV